MRGPLASRAAFWAASRAPRARMSAPMIWRPQMTFLDLVLMAAHYTASGPDSHSTRARNVLTPDRLFLVKRFPAAVGRRCNRWNSGDDLDQASNFRPTTGWRPAPRL